MQTSITADPSVLANGTLYGTGKHEIPSAVAEVALALGDAVIRGTDEENQVLKPSALFDASADFRGFVILPNTKEKLLSDPTGTAAWDQFDSVSVAEEGKFSIQSETAFTAGVLCQVVVISAGATAAQTVGKLSATVEVNNCQPINARFVTSGLAGEVAVINIYRQV